MVGDNDVGSAPVGQGDFGRVADAGVDGDDEGSALGDKTLDSQRSHTMAFGNGVRQVGDHAGTEALEGFAEDRGGGDAVDVEVAEDGDGFPGADSRGEPGQGGIDTGKGIGRVGYVGRIEEPGQLGRIADATGQQQLDGGGRQVDREAVAFGPRREQPAPRRRSMPGGGHGLDRVNTITEL